MTTLVTENIISNIGDKLIGLYHYEKEPNSVIPIFVVENMQFEVFDGIKDELENTQFIILTRDDIVRGNDIFPLKFLHMKTHTTLQNGEDVLAKLMIDKNQLRNNIEFELRNKLIQLRESYLSFDGKKEFLQYILPVMLMIWEGVLYLYDKTAYPQYEELKNQLTDVVHAEENIFDTLVDTTIINDQEVTSLIQKISHYLESLTRQIDKYKAN